MARHNWLNVREVITENWSYWLLKIVFKHPLNRRDIAPPFSAKSTRKICFLLFAAALLLFPGCVISPRSFNSLEDNDLATKKWSLS